jgi:hypothetical protein
MSNKSVFNILFIILVGCVNKAPENTLEIKVKELKELNSYEFKGVEGSFYSAKLELINNSQDSIRFWTFTCYWQINWISNSNQLDLFNLGCNSNFPIVSKIPRDGKISYNCILQLHDKSKEDFKFRLGFILIKENELKPHPYEEFMKVLSEKGKNKRDVYWSNTFYLDH